MNRLYYSKKQEYIAGANLVNVNGNWAKYTQWNSHKHSDAGCNWDDAVLVLETDDEPKIKIIKRHIDNNSDPFEQLLLTMTRYYEVQNNPAFEVGECFNIAQIIKDLDKRIDDALATGDKNEFMKLSHQRNMFLLEV